MMKTEQIVKALKHRIDSLETLGQELTNMRKNNKDETLMHVHFENEARISELSTILEYITKNNKDETKNTP